MGAVVGGWRLGGGGDGGRGVHLLGGSWKGGRSLTLGVVFTEGEVRRRGRQELCRARGPDRWNRDLAWMMTKI